MEPCRYTYCFMCISPLSSKYYIPQDAELGVERKLFAGTFKAFLRTVLRISDSDYDFVHNLTMRCSMEPGMTFLPMLCGLCELFLYVFLPHPDTWMNRLTPEDCKNIGSCHLLLNMGSKNIEDFGLDHLKVWMDQFIGIPGGLPRFLMVQENMRSKIVEHQVRYMRWKDEDERRKGNALPQSLLTSAAQTEAKWATVKPKPRNERSVQAILATISAQRAAQGQKAMFGGGFGAMMAAWGQQPQPGFHHVVPPPQQQPNFAVYHTCGEQPFQNGIAHGVPQQHFPSNWQFPNYQQQPVHEYPAQPIYLCPEHQQNFHYPGLQQYWYGQPQQQHFEQGPPPPVVITGNRVMNHQPVINGDRGRSQNNVQMRMVNVANNMQTLSNEPVIAEQLPREQANVTSAAYAPSDATTERADDSDADMSDFN